MYPEKVKELKEKLEFGLESHESGADWSLEVES